MTRKPKHGLVRGGKPGVEKPLRQRDKETLVELQQAEDTKDLRRLRQLAAVRGLVSNDVRARLWPALAGADAARAPGAGAAYAGAAAAPHKDSATVDVDVARSLWGFMPGAGEGDRREARGALARLLNALVVSHGGDVHYYQGLHDVASVLLLVAGEAPAYAILCRLATGALRDATRPTLDPVLELLALMGPLVEAADPELAALSSDLGLPPYYALSWFITWFAHDVPTLPAAARLFDLFLSTHPLMPLYAGAAAMASQRARLLAAGRGEGGVAALHSALNNLEVTKALSADELAVQALALYRQRPPEQIIARRGLRAAMAVAPRAYMDRASGLWRVPEPSKGALDGGGGGGSSGGGSAGGGSGGGGGKGSPQWKMLQQSVTKLLLPGARDPPPHAVLLSLGLYTAFAAFTWAFVRLQAEAGGGGGWGGG